MFIQYHMRSRGAFPNVCNNLITSTYAESLATREQQQRPRVVVLLLLVAAQKRENMAKLVIRKCYFNSEFTMGARDKD